LLVKAFRSPLAVPSFESSAPGSSFPASYFARSPAVSTARSVFRLHNPFAGLHRFGLFRRFRPVAASTAGSFRRSPVFAPLRDCYIPRDHSVYKFRCGPVRLPKSPDFLSLPAAISSDWAADHRSWFATFSEALLFALKSFGRFVCSLAGNRFHRLPGHCFQTRRKLLVNGTVRS
jgi:hypothetical protein